MLRPAYAATARPPHSPRRGAQILFAGFFIKSSQIPEALRWLQYVCSLKYGINLLLVAEFGPDVTAGWNETLVAGAERLLQQEGVTPDRWWVDGAVLLSLIVAFRFVSILALSRRASKSEF